MKRHEVLKKAVILAIILSAVVARHGAAAAADTAPETTAVTNAAAIVTAPALATRVRAQRLAGGPIIRQDMPNVKGRNNQLRDPALFRENDRTYLVYAYAGENGLALAELLFEKGHTP